MPNRDLHEAMAKPENDREYKLHVLSKLDCLEKSQIKRDKSDLHFKYKIFALVVILTGVKESILKFINMK